MPRPLAVLLLALALAGCKTDLYSKITEREANEMVSALSTQGIAGTKTSPDEKTWTVQVDEKDLPRAVETLKAFGLPKDTHQTIGDIFKKEGLVSTPSEERIRFIYAMSQELSNTISQIDGIITARVHVVIPANDPLAEKVTPASASVFIKHRPGLDIEAITPSIKKLVQRSIEGLPLENISISAFVSAPDVEVAPPAAAGTERLLTAVLAGLAALAAIAVGAFLVVRRGASRDPGHGHDGVAGGPPKAGGRVAAAASALRAKVQR